jgi:N-sulfoglucosamine sulfohydrolase
MIRWPSTFARGSVFKGLVTLPDVTATIAKVVSGQVPAQMDGIDLWDKSFKGHPFVAASRGRIDEQVDASRSVRTDRFKYIRNFMPETGYGVSSYSKYVQPFTLEMIAASRSGKLSPAQMRFFESVKPVEELYDLVRDPWEANNLATKEHSRNILNQMRLRMKAWLESIADPLSEKI